MRVEKRFRHLMNHTSQKQEKQKKLPHFVIYQGNVKALTEPSLTATGAVNESQQ